MLGVELKSLRLNLLEFYGLELIFVSRDINRTLYHNEQRRARRPFTK